MMDLMLLSHCSGMIYSDSAYRCRACGQGPVMAGDGFLYDRCMNCGFYSSYEPIDLGLGKLMGKIVARIKKAGARLFKGETPVPVACEGASVGGAQ